MLTHTAKTTMSKFYLPLSKIILSLDILGGIIKTTKTQIAKLELVRDSFQKTSEGILIQGQEPFIDFTSNDEIKTEFTNEPPFEF